MLLLHLTPVSCLKLNWSFTLFVSDCAVQFRYYLLYFLILPYTSLCNWLPLLHWYHLLIVWSRVCASLYLLSFGMQFLLARMQLCLSADCSHYSEKLRKVYLVLSVYNFLSCSKHGEWWWMWMYVCVQCCVHVSIINSLCNSLLYE